MVGNPVVGNPVNFPVRATPFTGDGSITVPDGDGTTEVIVPGGEITQPWFLLLLALFARTGGGTGEVTLTVDPAVIDSAGAPTQLKLQLSFVQGNNGSVALPPYIEGKFAVVFNIGAQPTNVVPNPQAGAQINALGINGAFALAAGKCQIFWFATSTQIYTTQLG